MMGIVEDVKKIMNVVDLLPQPSYRVYRLFGGTLHRQDVKGGNWVPLSTNEANEILRKLDIDIEEE